MLRNLLLMFAGAVSCVVALELVLRVMPISTYSDTGYYIDPLIITYRPHHRFRSSWGWDLHDAVNHEVNNLGFLSARDFVPDRQALAVIGDSFVDASMLPDTDRIGTQLQRLVAQRAVYAMGGPGSSLLDYAERLRYAAEHLQVEDFVVIVERGDIKQAYCGSGNIHGPCLERASGQPTTQLRPPPSAAQRYLRHSALLQYLLGHLRFDPAQRFGRFLASLSARQPGHTGVSQEYSKAELEHVLDRFFARIERYRHGRLVMVFDCDRNALERGVAARDAARADAMAFARAHGAVVIDTEPTFRDDLAATGRYLEVSPLDGHWNRAATALVARDIAAVFATPALHTP